MGLLDKLFGNKDNRRPNGAATSQFEDESENASAAEVSTRNAPRRELVQVVLRDTMRKHGIPSDWIECRILSVVSTTRGTGMHVLLVVRQGDDRLAAYVHAFQHSFMQELLRFEPRAGDWLFSISWQFDNKPQDAVGAMPDPSSWRGPETAEAGPETISPDEEDELQQDLQALFAIRDAALKDPDAAAAAAPEPEPESESEPDRPDFEPTRPGEADSEPPRRG